MKLFKRVFLVLLCIGLFGTSLFSASALYYPSDVDEVKQLYVELVERFENDDIAIGDINEDGAVNTSDARLTLQLAVSTKMPIQFDPNQLETSGSTDEWGLWGFYSPTILLADVDGSYKISTTDARLILQYAVGKIKSFDRVDLS